MITSAALEHAQSEEAVKPRRGRRPLVIMLILFALLAAVVGGGLLWAKNQIEGDLHTIGDPFAALASRPATPPVAAGQAAPVNVLILGSDSRIDAGDPSQWTYGAQRTDTIMLLHVPADRKGAVVVSIPRDTWVDIPGYGPGKINAAYSYGGPTLLIQTIENLTGVRMDHFAVTDFESLATLTDEMGGVEIDGQLLNGEQALAYVRERDDLPNGDLDRVKRQQNWLRAMSATDQVAAARKDPSKVFGLVSAASDSLAVDDGLSLQEIVDLARDVRAAGSARIIYLTAPVAGTGTSPDGTQSIVNLDAATATEVFNAMANDQLDAYIRAHTRKLEILGQDVP